MRTVTEQSRTILERFQVRKSKKQKEEFRVWLCGALEEAGYAPKVETAKGLLTSRNVVAGDPEGAEVIFTAHYDTCAVLPVPNFITPRNMFFYLAYQVLLVAAIFAAAFAAGLVPALLNAPFGLYMAVAYGVLVFCVWWMMFGRANRHTVNDNTSGVLTLMEIALALPEERRAKVCFVFFDNEETGLFGSKGFAAKHKPVKKDALVVNFDCVSDGDHIHLYPNKRVKGDEETLARLEGAFLPVEGKAVELVRGFGFYPSDQRSFRRGVGVCALKKKPVIGWYMDRIHTRRDTVLEEANIALLREGALRLAGTTTE